MIHIIDYGAGNLQSVCKAFCHFGVNVKLTSDPKIIAKADKIVLPGVGAFGACVDGLGSIDGMIDAIYSAVEQDKKPMLGICVGMQILFDEGLEFYRKKGLGYLKGTVEKFNLSDKNLKIPHMGWNNISIEKPHPVLDSLDSCHMYFVHSYIAKVKSSNNILASCDYGDKFCAAAGRDNIIAVQFHPEKSQKKGLKLIENFIKWKP